ncbi:TetR/AcrR family transcriptional regulator [Actinoalloteichus caeruleus]|uniref:Transcriptional regulator, TetR family n=1 Tax=Actinoalloteichus caeruleus DSM 43889 TaxID=1120930 RepID=A0ABT1JJN5_ACTCY|nr:TetR/AcrR family transcriptional regulator [Actinoalloteichus caeruleus]MCP2332509.1 transcriptional regulator, TetR family [Actinoalloteichus caeruleus DSM 43889]
MRADAERNREAVLRAAGRLFDATDDPERVSMDDIAAEARVGKGTLFRRFGDRAGLIRALYEERTERLRTSLAPDPARSPLENVTLLMTATLRFKSENRALARALENQGSGSPYTNAGYDHWHRQLAELIAEARGPEAADFLAHALLAAVRSDLVAHLDDWPAERVRAGVATLAASVMGQPTGTGPAGMAAAPERLAAADAGTSTAPPEIASPDAT